MEGAEGGEHLVYHSAGFRLAREIGGDGADSRAGHGLDNARRGRPRGGLVAIHEGDSRALFGEESPRRFADAAAPARDEGDAAGHASRHARDQARVSWPPGLTTTRAIAPSTQLASGGSTTEAERTQKDSGFSAGTMPSSRRALAAPMSFRRT